MATNLSDSFPKALGEVQADDKARVSLGKAQVRKGDKFIVREGPDGSILLERAATIPARELDLWDNPALLESVKRGLAQYASGDLVDADEDFTRYLDD